MNIGEFFLTLGIKGDGPAFKALSSISNSFTDLSAKGIATKASILGAVYALEQFTGQSADYGAGIQNFSTLTGESTVKVQQLAEAIRKATHLMRGPATQESENFIKNFQSLSTQWRMKGTPMGEWANQFARATGYDLYNTDWKVFFEAAQRLPKSGYPIGFQNEMLETMKVSKALIDTSRSDKIGDITKITSNIEGAGIIANLSEIEGEWSNFWTKLDVVRNKYVAKWGHPILRTLNHELDVLDKKLQGFDKWIKNHPTTESKETSAWQWLNHWFDAAQNGLNNSPRSQHFLEDALGALASLNVYKWLGALLGSGTTAAEIASSTGPGVLGVGGAEAGAAAISNPATAVALGVAATLFFGGRWLRDYLATSAVPTLKPLSHSNSKPTKRTRKIKDKRHAQINVNVNQFGVKDSYDGTDRHSQEVARAYYSITTVGQVA